jgi:hypothetical protein
LAILLCGLFEIFYLRMSRMQKIIRLILRSPRSGRLEGCGGP